jgi:hypothetical protein
MWQRFDREFTLGPRQAASFKYAALVLWDHAQESEWETDVLTFDRLTNGQKQAALLEVCRALLDPQAPPPKVTGELAATVDAVFRELETQVHSEIDNAEEIKLEKRLPTEARSLVLAAVEETGYWTAGACADEPAEEPPSPTCTDYAEWNYLVEILETEILDDFDFEHADHFLDLPPRMTCRLKQRLNIDPGYFTSTTEDPKPERLAAIQAELCALIGEKENR